MKKPRPPRRDQRRPDLSWAERLLGETLKPLSLGTPKYPAAKPKRDPTVIPMGNYCYYPWPNGAGHAPCPYFKETSHGTTTCAYTGIEAYDPDYRRQKNKVERYFGSAAIAAAAGVVRMLYLPDAIKICDVNSHDASYVERDLEPDLLVYEESVAGERIVGWACYSTLQKRFPDEQKRLLSAGWTRFVLWETLCAMVEPVPIEVIERIVQADAAFREKTEPSTELMDEEATKELPSHPDPARQFWYFYRKNKPDSWQGATGIWGSD
jgi:hypothetical protein